MAETLLNLRSFAKEISDLENSGFVSDANWNFYINNAQRGAFGILVKLFEDYFLTSVKANFVNNQQDYTLPTDFWKIRGVDLAPNGDFTEQGFTAYPFNWTQRNRLKYLTIFSPPVYNSNHRYRILGSTIRFEPVPTDASTQYQLWYIQLPTTMTLDTDTTIIPDIFLEYVALKAAYQALRKQEVDLTFIRQDLMEAKQDMIAAANTRRADMAPTISTQANDYEGQSNDGYTYTFSRVRDV